MRMDHDPAPRSIFPRFGFRYWPKTVIRSKCSEWLLRAHTVSAIFPLCALSAPKFLHMPDFARRAISGTRSAKHIAANNSFLQNNLRTQ